MILSAACFNLNECDFPPLPSPATRCKPLHAPVKCLGPVRKPVRCFFKSFAQGYEPFRLAVLPPCSVPTSVSLNKKLIIIWMNNITPKMIPVRTEMLENTLW